MDMDVAAFVAAFRKPHVSHTLCQAFPRFHRFLPILAQLLQSYKRALSTQLNHSDEGDG